MVTAYLILSGIVLMVIGNVIVRLSLRASTSQPRNDAWNAEEVFRACFSVAGLAITLLGFCGFIGGGARIASWAL